MANIRDITERKNAELALQESEAIKAQLLTAEIDRINQELETNQKLITAATLKINPKTLNAMLKTIDRFIGN